MLRIIFALTMLTLPAAARDNGQWKTQPAYLRQWFQQLMQPDNPYMSQYVAIITNGRTPRRGATALGGFP